MQKKVTDSKESNSKVYEIGFHIVSTIAEENVPAETDKIKAFLSNEGASVISEEAPKLRPLAYSIRKAFGGTYKTFDKAYFGWVKFELDGDITNIEKLMKNNENVLRFILVKTVKENTMYSPKLNTFSRENKKVLKTEASKDAKQASIEEIDKSIEELVA
jgi:ribosomal protein S6